MRIWRKRRRRPCLFCRVFLANNTAAARLLAKPRSSSELHTASELEQVMFTVEKIKKLKAV